MLDDAQTGAFRHDGVLALPGLFAFAEVAWLREAAIALAVGAGATRGAAGFAPLTIRDIHLREPGFRKLAGHPRLVGPVRRLLGAEAELLGTWLCFGAACDLRPGTIGAVVFLDVATARHGGDRLSSALLIDGAARHRDPRPDSGALAFVATFGASAAHADRGPAGEYLRNAAEPDDCLWPNPFIALG